ncbi:MAG: serine/threonine protein kinase [Lachnospiraceae bacterium]|nr:serine/threonine protein kinase [Lachnospiraceae bacterium]
MKEGILFDRYEIIKEIGHGAFSKVYLVRDKHLDKLMALKMVNDLPDENTELETLKALSNDAFPVLYDYRQDEGHCYLFMEYVDGMTLREYLDKNGKAEVKKTIGWIKKIAQILRFLHKQKPPVIYRDLKPENIMIRPDGSIKLIDFGGILRRSRSLDESKGNYATRGYGAPELFRTKKPEPSSDIFSLGAVMHEMLTGVNPNKPPVARKKIRDIDRSLPEGLEIIVEKCLKKDPQERYQSMDDLIKDIENYRKLKTGAGVWFALKLTLLSGLYIALLISILYPLVNGINKEDIPFPYLYAPGVLLILSLVMRSILFGNGRKNEIKEIKKDIFLTEKRYMGLLGAVLFMLGALSSLIMVRSGETGVLNSLVFARPGKAGALAGAPEKDMWVSLCDADERNVLVKKGGVMKITDKVRLEIQKEDVPPGTVSIQVIATGDDGTRYVSKNFDVEKTP